MNPSDTEPPNATAPKCLLLSEDIPHTTSGITKIDDPYTVKVELWYVYCTAKRMNQAGDRFLLQIASTAKNVRLSID